MSKLSEYLALVPEGFKNITEVIDGLRNQLKMELGTIPKAHEEEIIRRRLICDACPFLSTNATKAGVYFSARKDEHCTMCGCPKATRTASLEAECGIATYNANPQNINNKLPLKWEAYKPNSDERENETASTNRTTVSI